MKKIWLALALAAALGHPGVAQTPPPQEAATTQAEHPYFRQNLLPAWSKMTPQQWLADARAAMAETRARQEALATLSPQEATFENSFLAYARMEEELQQVQGYGMHLLRVAATPELQQARQTLMAELAQFHARNPQADTVACLLSTLADAPWVQELSPARRRLVQQIRLRLLAAGATLSPEQRTRKAAIEQEIRLLEQQFLKNLEGNHHHRPCIITRPEDLAGMPEKWMQQAAAAAREKGYATPENPAWLINHTTAAAQEVLAHCTVEETRRQCWQSTKLAPDNESALYRTMELRHELATMLGFRHFADMQAASRMMESGEEALAFVDKMLQALKPRYDAEVAAYMARLSQAAGKTLTRLNPWDETYLSRRAPAPPSPGFDSSTLTPYFRAEKVLEGLLHLWENMLAIRIAEQPTAHPAPGENCPPGKIEVWHPSVRAYTVHDTATGTHLGTFYLDLYPRPGKRGEGWTVPLRFGRSGEPHLAAIVTNITPPGNPHLLHHGDVYVLFHEFGHLMHMLLGHPELPEQNAMSVERDFIEMPSQLQEQWIWEPEALALFAFHHQSGEPLPAESARRLAESRGQTPASPTMRMLRLSKLDLEMNISFHEKFKGRPLDTVAAELLAPWDTPYSAPVPSDIRSVHHIMNPGYAAGFYTYIWSEVLSMDAFTRFRQEGVLNPATGAAYRKSILEPGGSKPAPELFRDFMGRDPDTAAFLRRFAAP